MDAWISSATSEFWPYIKVIFSLIAVSWALKMLVNKLFKWNIPGRLMAAVPLVLGLAYVAVFGSVDFHASKSIVKALITGMTYGALATSFYDVVADKLFYKLEDFLGTFLSKFQNGDAAAAAVIPPPPGEVTIQTTVTQTPAAPTPPPAPTTPK